MKAFYFIIFPVLGLVNDGMHKKCFLFLCRISQIT